MRRTLRHQSAPAPRGRGRRTVAALAGAALLFGSATTAAMATGAGPEADEAELTEGLSLEDPTEATEGAAPEDLTEEGSELTDPTPAPSEEATDGDDDSDLPGEDADLDADGEGDGDDATIGEASRPGDGDATDDGNKVTTEEAAGFTSGDTDERDGAVVLEEIQPRAGLLSCEANTVYSIRGNGKLYEIFATQGTTPASGTFTAGANEGYIGQWPGIDRGANALGLGRNGEVAWAVAPYGSQAGGSIVNKKIADILKYTPGGGFEKLYMGPDGVEIDVTASVAAGGVNLLNDGFYFGSYWTVSTTDLRYSVYRFDEDVYNAEIAKSNPNYAASIKAVGYIKLQKPAANTDLAFDDKGNLYIVLGSTGSANEAKTTQIHVVTAEEVARGEALASGARGGELLASNVVRGTESVKIDDGSPNTNPSTGVNEGGGGGGVNGIAFDGLGGVYLSNNHKIGLYNATNWDPMIAVNGAGLPIPYVGNITRWQSADLGGCASPPNLTVKKDVTERAAAGDQFKLAISDSAGELISATTTGTDKGLQREVAGPMPAAAGATYSITEVMGDGSASSLAYAYDSSWECAWTNAQDDMYHQLGTGTGTAGSVTIPNVAGASVECTFTNTPKPATVELDKEWTVNGRTIIAEIAGSLGFTADPYLAVAGETLDPEGNAPVIADEWGTIHEGFHVGNKVNVGEINASTVGNESHPGCYLSSSTLTGTTLQDSVTLAERPEDGAEWETQPWFFREAPLAAGANEFKVTNNIVCEQSLTLVKHVVNPSPVVDDRGPFSDLGGPADWTLTATSSTAGVPPVFGSAVPEHEGDLTGLAEFTVPVGEYTLSEHVAQDPQDPGFSPAVYAPSGWSCSVNGGVATAGEAVTLLDGQSAECTITNSTAELTVLKLAEGVLMADQFEVSATGPEGLPSLDAVDGSKVASGENSVLVLPGATYALSEAAKDGSTPPFVQKAFEKYVPSGQECPAVPTTESFDEPDCWTSENVSADSVSLEAGERGFYRFVNYTPDAPTLPLTGGQGAAFFAILGGGLVLGAGGLVALSRRRRPAEQI